MMPRFRTAAVVTLLVVPIVAGGFLLQEPPVHANARLFDQVESIIARQYVDSLGEGAIYQKAAHGLVRELNDPYSELFSPKETEAFNRGTGGRYGGTGMLLEDQRDAVAVARVFPHTPAEEAGVLEGDRIIAINDTSTANWGLNKVSNALRGDPGSAVSVTYTRPGVSEPIKLRFTRVVVHVPAVELTTMIEPGVGYIALQTFNENTAEELESAVATVERQGARGIVLDMRDNGGGIVEQALAVSSLFLKDGQEIVSVRTRGGDGNNVEISRSQGRHIATSIPLVVMVDGSSASATEIVAGALQDHDRALVVGTQTFGKGLVQSVFSLEDGYALKMTTGKWYTPSGRSIHRDRKLLPDGRLVATDDSVAADSAKRARPAFKSDAGRVVYGGGGITPDVIVPDDTLSSEEQQFLRSIASKRQIVNTVIGRYALELKSQSSPSFNVQPAWSAELDRRLLTAGVRIDAKDSTVANRLIDRQLAERITRLAFGDAAAKKRDLGDDHQLLKAIDLLRQSSTQADLFAAARASNGRRGN